MKCNQSARMLNMLLAATAAAYFILGFIANAHWA